MGEALNEIIEESNDADITDATSVIVGSELSLSERKSLIDGFVNYIEEMCEGDVQLWQSLWLWNRRGRGVSSRQRSADIAIVAVPHFPHRNLSTSGSRGQQAMTLELWNVFG